MSIQDQFLRRISRAGPPAVAPSDGATADGTAAQQHTAAARWAGYLGGIDAAARAAAVS